MEAATAIVASAVFAADVRLGLGGGVAVSVALVRRNTTGVGVAIAVDTRDRAWMQWDGVTRPVGRSGSVLGEVLEGFFRHFCLCILGTDRG